MSVSSISNRNTPKYLYTGQITASAAPTSKKSPSSGAGAETGVVVAISDEAKAALAASESQPSASGGSVRDRLKDQYKAATAAGTFISFDSSKGGKWLDMSSFTDDELSEVALNRGGDFSQDEKDLAGGALSGRLEYSLRPYAQAAGLGDRRAQVSAINSLYSKMSDNVRAALDFTPAVMASGNSMLQGDIAKFGWLDLGLINSWLGQASDQGGLQFAK